MRIRAQWRVVVWCIVVIALWGVDGVEVQCVARNDSQIPSTHTMVPSNITLHPVSEEWRLDFTLMKAVNAGPQVCVTLEMKRTNMRLLFFMGTCEDGDIRDYQLWELQEVKPKVWTMIQVTNNDTSINLQTDHGTVTSLNTRGVTLPPHGLLQVTHSRSVQSAVGCRVNCPAERVASPTDRKANVADFKQENAFFFFKPGEDFKLLNFEVRCLNSFGKEIFAADTDKDIKDNPQLDRWHKVVLQVNISRQEFKIIIDGRMFKNATEGLKVCFKFSSMVVRTKGVVFVSLNCDPTTGEKHEVPQCARDDNQTFSGTTYVSWGLLVVCIVIITGGILYHKKTVSRYNLEKQNKKNSDDEEHLKSVISTTST